MRTVSPNASFFSSQVSQTRRFYHGPDRTDSAAHLAVVAGGREWCSADFLIERESFPYTALEFVWTGKGRLRLGQRWHDLSAGMVFVFDRSVPHIIRSDPAQPLVKYFFNFRGARIRQLCAELRLRPGSIFRTAEPGHLVDLMDEAIDRALQGGRSGLRAAAAVLEHALVICAQSRRPPRTPPEAAHSTYLRCRNFLYRHYPALSSVTQAARACSVTPAYMTRLFQRYEQETPYACLLRLKMTEALLRLSQPGLQVKGVAADFGFKSAAHFSRAFKKFHGIQPREAREAAVLRAG